MERPLHRAIFSGRLHCGVVACSAAIVFGMLAGRCDAISIVLDYSNDSFFANHATAKATLEAAAQDLSSFITTSLGATSDTSTGNSNGSTATFDFSFSYQNPSNSAVNVTIPSAVLPANQITVFVGVQNLSGNTLGQGGPGGVGYQVSGMSTGPTDFANAVHNAETAANNNMGRGGPISGPILSHSSNSIGGVSFNLNFGSTIGDLWFDVDSNNDGVTDSDATLNNYWQFDRNAPVGPSQNDFYSVALHEMTHALGFGTSQSWNSLVSSPHNWLGSQVISLEGTGTNVLSTNNDHVAEGLLSTRLSDGATQEAVMDPTLTVGTRKTFTRLDLAFLRDIGWQTIAFPLLVGDFNQDNRRTVADVQAMMKALSDVHSYETQHNFDNAKWMTVADVNGDHVVNNLDLQALITLLANSGGQASLQMVPEPGSLLLWSLGGLGMVSWLRLRGRTTNAVLDES